MTLRPDGQLHSGEVVRILNVDASDCFVVLGYSLRLSIFKIQHSRFFHRVAETPRGDNCLPFPTASPLFFETYVSLSNATVCRSYCL